MNLPVSNIETLTSAKIIQDSINTTGNRLTTMEVTFPRFILPEFNTHRSLCLSGSSLIFFDKKEAVDKGIRRLIKTKLSDLYEMWKTKDGKTKVKEMCLRSVDEDTLKIYHTSVKDIFYSGIKKVYLITTRKGKFIRCTGQHRLLTDNGWKSLADLGAIQLPESNEVALPFKVCLTVCDSHTTYKEAISSIVYLGEEKVYDIEVEGPFHNFVADGICSHNSRNSASCLTGETLVAFNHKHATLKGKYHRFQKPLKEIVEKFEKNPDLVKSMDIRILNEDTKIYETSHIKNVFRQGIQDVYKITLKNKKTITCTENHQLYTESGWTTLKEQNLTKSLTNIISWNKNFPKLATNGEHLSKDDLIKELSLGKYISTIAKERDLNTYELYKISRSLGVYPLRANILQNIKPFYTTYEELKSYKELGYCNKKISEILNTKEDKIKKVVSIANLTGYIGLILHGDTKRCPWNTGKSYKQKEESLVNVRAAAERRRKPGSYIERKKWQDGRTQFHTQIRDEMLKKFNYKCAATGSGIKLQLHHVVPVWKDKSKLFDKDNIIVICKEFHDFLHHRNLDLIFMEWWLSKKDISLFVSANSDTNMKCLDINKPKAPGKLLLVKYSPIVNIEYIGKEETFDLEIDGKYPNFVANGIVVHNSRAIPVWKNFVSIIDNPVCPRFQKNKPGMQSTEDLSEDEQKDSLNQWLIARDNALFNAVALTHRENKTDTEIKAWKKIDNHLHKSWDGFVPLKTFNVHKQWVNRLIEPFLWHTVIVSATEWHNFFRLRYDKDAQPEIKILSKSMLRAYLNSKPVRLIENEWHIPYISAEERSKFSIEDQLKFCAARCARVSYLNHDGKINYENDIKLHDRLSASGHWSAFEHAAKAKIDNNYYGNFKGWFQYRKQFSNECFSKDNVDLSEWIQNDF